MPNRRTQVSRLRAEITSVAGEVGAISRILNNELEKNCPHFENTLRFLLLNLANAVKELAEKQAELLDLVVRYSDLGLP